MDPRVYRCRFKYDKRRKDLIPNTSAMPPAEYDPEDRAFIVRTFDGGIEGRGSYYIVIKNEDKDDEDWKLSIEGIDGDDKYLIYSKSERLWYPKVYLKEMNDGKFRQECVITSRLAAGFCTITATNKENENLTKPINILVQPNLFDLDDYKYMLTRMAETHDRLLINKSSPVGLGSESTDKTLPGTPEYDLELWRRLKPTVLKIMNAPATLLKQEWQDLPQHKIRHYNGRTMRGLLTQPGKSKLPGTIYTDEYDTQENRAIKAVLNLCHQRFSIYRLESTDNLEGKIDSFIKSDWEATHDINFEDLKSTIKMPVPCEPDSPKRDANVEVLKKYSEITEDSNESEHLCKRLYKCKCCLDVPNSGDIRIIAPKFPLKPELFPAVIRPFNSLETALIWLFKFLLVKGRKVKIENKDSYTITDTPVTVRDDYKHIEDAGYKAIRNWKEQEHTVENLLQCIEALHDSVFGESEIINIGVRVDDEECDDGFELIKFYARRKKMYERSIKRQVDLSKVDDELKQILESPWFKRITDTNIATITRTPKFIHDPLYRKAYEQINEIIERHPSCSLTNEFTIGIHEMNRIYEYWVLYELLDRLLNLGFSLREEPTDDHGNPANILRRFIDGNESDPEGIVIPLKREVENMRVDGTPIKSKVTIPVDLGFNVTIQEKSEAQRWSLNSLRPDYYLRIRGPYSNHDNWYFLDAKCYSYSNFEELKGPAKHPRLKGKTIEEVCLGKYINKMKELLPKYTDMDKTKVCGAYLLIAELKNRNNADMLFGNKENIIESDEDKQTHRYGAAVVNPSQLNSIGSLGSDDLTALLRLIFEYREGAEQYSDRPATLCACWNSSIDHAGLGEPTVTKESTISGKTKYYFRCPCGDLRVESFCWGCNAKILKHDTGNYHYRFKGEKWLFKCPNCGKDKWSYNNDSDSYDY